MNLYNQLFKTYFYLAQMLFPKDSPRQREYLLVKTSLLGDKMKPYFEKVGGVKALARCRSAKEVLEEAKHIQETEWPPMVQLANYFVIMGEDEQLARQVSLNKTAFLLDKKVRKEKGKAETSKAGFRIQNDPNYRERWRIYRGVAHLLTAYGAMKLDFLEKDNPDNIPFEVFLALNLDAFLNRAYQEGQRLSQIIEPRLRQPIIPEDEFVKIPKPDIKEDDISAILMPTVSHTADMDELRETLSGYRAPVSI